MPNYIANQGARKSVQYLSGFIDPPEIIGKLPLFKPEPGFTIRVAITIPIKKNSGKIGDRFSDQNRSTIFVQKSTPGFNLQNGSRLKNRFQNKIPDGTQIRFAFLSGKNDQRFSSANRSSNFILRSDPDFWIIIAPWIAIKNYSGKTGDRFSDKD